MYNVQSTDYGVGVTGSYWGNLDCQVLRAPQYLNPALAKTVQRPAWRQWLYIVLEMIYWNTFELFRIGLGSFYSALLRDMYFGHVMRKKGDSLEKEIMQGTTPGFRSRGRPKTAWMSNITSWTGLSVEQLLRAVEDRYQWRLTAHDAANLCDYEDGWRQDKMLIHPLSYTGHIWAF